MLSGHIDTFKTSLCHLNVMIKLNVYVWLRDCKCSLGPLISLCPFRWLHYTKLFKTPIRHNIWLYFLFRLRDYQCSLGTFLSLPLLLPPLELLERGALQGYAQLRLRGVYSIIRVQIYPEIGLGSRSRVFLAPWSRSRSRLKKNRSRSRLEEKSGAGAAKN